jgi:type II secretory pathway pseudopilin PulG
MINGPLRSSSGFTYIAALVMVVIMGILLSQAAQVWSTRMQRERETELLFRGTQVRDAMRRWYNLKPPAVPGSPAPAAPVVPPVVRGNLPDLKALVVDPSMAGKTHFMRPSNLIDPMTGKEWGLVKDASQKIIGVASTSEAAPLKQGNFPFDLEPNDFEGKKKYSDWKFDATHFPKPGAIGGGVTGLKGTSNPTTGPGPGPGK